MLTIPCKTHKEQKNKQTKRWVKLVGKIENVGKVDIPTNQYIIPVTLSNVLNPLHQTRRNLIHFVHLGALLFGNFYQKSKINS